MCIIKYFEFFEIMFLLWHYSSYYPDVFAVLVLESSERLHTRTKKKQTKIYRCKNIVVTSALKKVEIMFILTYHYHYILCVFFNIIILYLL